MHSGPLVAQEFAEVSFGVFGAWATAGDVHLHVAADPESNMWKLRPSEHP